MQDDRVSRSLLVVNTCGAILPGNRESSIGSFQWTANENARGHRRGEFNRKGRAKLAFEQTRVVGKPEFSRLSEINRFTFRLLPIYGNT